ncbi:hypothetical protein RF11_04385 [Thelohanellus kitauei]|uniref:Uncharacterized protein n=1 Tax=Thelohanellus kitauei TaxID=669202 RepID=A0A0C2MVT7_THEKT|nr:hypothetical protein RF11_04385 [Thelohanellus kitauei]
MILFDYQISEFKFTSDGSQLVMLLNDSYQMELCYIRCNSYQVNTVIEISGCNISFVRERFQRTRNYSIGYRFKFNTNTHYVFSKYLISSIPKKKKNESIELTLDIFEMQFPNYTQTCERPEPKITGYTPISARLASTDEIYPCKPNDTQLTTGSVTSVSTNFNPINFWTGSSQTFLLTTNVTAPLGSNTKESTAIVTKTDGTQNRDTVTEGSFIKDTAIVLQIITNSTTETPATQERIASTAKTNEAQPSHSGSTAHMVVRKSVSTIYTTKQAELLRRTNNENNGLYFI